MISLEKWKILTPLQNLPKNDLGQLVVVKGFKKLPKVKKIAKSGHTERIHWMRRVRNVCYDNSYLDVGCLAIPKSLG